MNSVSKRSRTYRTAWLFLALAIIAEVTGTSFMADAARGGGENVKQNIPAISSWPPH